MKKTMLSTKQSYLVCFIGILAAFGIVMALCESGLADSYIKGIMMTACIAIIMTTSLNLTIGVLGQLTLGCCGFEAIGAYVAALTSKYMVAAGIAIDPTARFLLTTLIGGVVACVFGILIGIPALRLHGDYLAIITLGFGEIIRVIIQNLKVAGGMGLDKGAAGQALIGALIGIAGYCALMPAVMLIPFQEQRFTFEQLWVGPLALVITLAGVAILALISSLVTLRRVAITPLGVTSRTATALPSGTRMVLFVVVVVVAMIVFKNPAMLAQAGQAVMYGVIIGFMLLCFALVNLIGTWVITARAKAKAKRPKDAATMIAMRRILDNPKRAWRNVSGIALAVFIAGITSICGFFGSAAVVDDANDPFTVFIRDIGTGGILTLVFAAVLAAVSSGVMQAGSVYDQAGEYRMLVLEGTDVKTLNRARFIEVLTPLNIVVIVAGGCSMLLMAPLFAASMTEPATLASFFGGLVLCYALVSIGAFASNHVAASLNLTDYRADD